nr:unnamed protein product [Spirometra erinaceieuropaei]
MSDFRDSEASEASEDEGSEKKFTNENKADLSVSSDSEEEEEIPDEEEICRKEGKGWIVNDDEEEEEVARDLGGDNIEILDSTRVHPESYDLAKQMAKDALEYDDTDDNNPSAALEEIVQRQVPRNSPCF